MTNKHIVISPASYDHLDALAKNWRMDKKEFTEHIINYFRLTGDDPRATKRDNTVLALKKLQDTFVSFIRKHETDHLKKIVDDFEATRKKLEADQENQTTIITKEIQRSDALNDGRLGGYFCDGIGIPNEKSGAFYLFSMKGEFEKLAKNNAELAKNDQSILTIMMENNSKMEKKKVVLINRLEQMANEIKDWNLLTKDVNRGKATALINELKTLVNGTY